MRLPGYDTWLQRGYMDEGEPVTCAGTDDRDCPSRGIVFGEDDFAPGSDKCGTCGGETRVMDREELRGE